MYKVAVNKCASYGFSLSDKAIRMYAKLKGIRVYNICDSTIPRHDPALIHVIEALGIEANEGLSDIRIETTPSKLYRLLPSGWGYETLQVPEDIKWTVNDSED